MQGAQPSDSVLGVTTPGRFKSTGGVYYYNDLNSTEPQTTETNDLQLGLTKYRAIRAAVQNNLDTPVLTPKNVPNVQESEYGENTFSM